MSAAPVSEPIVVQDRFEVFAADLPRLRELVAGYAEGAAARGLTFVEEQVSPPLALADQPVTLWVRWTLPDAGGFWTARAQSHDPAVGVFWGAVDDLVVSRSRHYLVGPDATAPAPEDSEPYAVTPTAWRETAQLYLPHGAGEAELGALAAVLARAVELPGIESAVLCPNFVPNDLGAGHFTWDLVYPDRSSAEVARKSELWTDVLLPALDEHCVSRSALGLETVGAGAREPGLAGGVKRTALFRLLRDVTPEQVEAFARDTLAMPDHIAAIRNWRLSRAIPLEWDATAGEPWTFVWEQEYADLDGLVVDYMVHPHHWAHIDRWFDLESGAQIIDRALCHAFAGLAEAFIVR
ncbi:Dabb family protein [Nocardioides albidus]|uniref:Dabb family protein n=1 Tax=Nocardioides albidus TaxID=1517589 RepID=A0A5C4WRZ5_9ACTN|nr:Dabb family protein [Nocardioides albidus]TNM50189.1 Dabb family protein [Nocardioides albidus]